MIKLLDLLYEDTGQTGKAFEKTFNKALELVNMNFSMNAPTGALWDIKPAGTNWISVLKNKDVNIKVARTKWMWGTSKLSKILPWANIGDDWEEMEEYYKRLIKRWVGKYGVETVMYLKPKSDEIQNQIVKGVAKKDVNALNALMVNDNFIAVKLGATYDIRILTKDNRITSIVFDKKGRPFMRSTVPRNLNGTMFVSFRAARVHLGTPRNIKLKVS